jgi:acetyl-CoA C-acetyltransferase
VYLRSWSYATDPVFVAEHAKLWCSPAMRGTTDGVMRAAGIGIDDVAYLDLYSCFPSSLHFARDALALADGDDRPLTVTGGLPYFGGAASGYMTHSIGEMVRRVREAPESSGNGSYGLVTGVGMHMTKHVAALYANMPGTAQPPDPMLQETLDRANPPRAIAEAPDPADGAVTVAAYTVVHGSDGAPEWGVAVCDTAGDDPTAPRLYARIDDQDILQTAERDELVGRAATVRTERTETRRGQRVHNLLSATL